MASHKFNQFAYSNGNFGHTHVGWIQLGEVLSYVLAVYYLGGICNYSSWRLPPIRRIFLCIRFCVTKNADIHPQNRHPGPTRQFCHSIFRCFNGLRIVDTSHQLGAARARHGQPAGWRRLWSKAPQSTTSWLHQKAVLRSCWFQQTLWGFAVYQWIGFLGKILTGKPWFLPSNWSGLPVNFPVIQFCEYSVKQQEFETLISPRHDEVANWLRSNETWSINHEKMGISHQHLVIWPTKLGWDGNGWGRLRMIRISLGNL